MDDPNSPNYSDNETEYIKIVKKTKAAMILWMKNGNFHILTKLIIGIKIY